MFEPQFFAFDTGAATLNVAFAGDRSAPLIMCLHGFPEYWAGWREVMAELSRDYFVVVPDQRGYNLSSKPAAIEAYRVRHLVADLAALADHLSPERPFVLAGHDWGASVAYGYAFAHPERLTHLAVVNGVHPWCFQNAIYEDEHQRAASQYINKLREPETDARLVEDNCRRAFRMIEGFSPTPWMTEELRAGYRKAWTQPGAMTAMLNWYRASPIDVPAPGASSGRSMVLEMNPEAFAVRMPHLVVWGESDVALRPSCLDGLDRFAPGLTVERIPRASHWILHEKPVEVAEAIRQFLPQR